MATTESPNIEEIITLPELPKHEDIVMGLTCPKCLKNFKSKKPFEKHVDKCKEKRTQPREAEKRNVLDIDVLTPSAKDAEEQRLREQLKELVMANPTINLDKSYNDDLLKKIDNMDLDTLKKKLFIAKTELTKKVDMRISDSMLMFAGRLIGALLGCVDELNTELDKDVALRESARETLCLHFLSTLSPHVKVCGLFGADVGIAMSKATLRKAKERAMVTKVEEINENT
jgi:uncharacterized C2H2 Zn-finger protein/predicted DNA binding CopG/RHH family protein